VNAPANAVQRIGGALQKVPPAYWAASRALRLVGQRRRPGQIERYLAANERRRLRLGSGRHTDPGWLSADLLPVHPRVIFMDVTRPWPLPSQSFDVIHCEHVIEHLSYEGGLAMLGEAHRVLRPGGVLRIATPNLALVARLISVGGGGADAAIADYVRWSNDTYGTAAERRDSANAAFVANRMVRNWGHTFIYDDATLRGALAGSSFHDIVPVIPGESAHAELRGVDRHHEEIGVAANDLETLAFEAMA
jgi:predicted SAM-dependent methyltransferase